MDGQTHDIHLDGMIYTVVRQPFESTNVFLSRCWFLAKRHPTTPAEYEHAVVESLRWSFENDLGVSYLAKDCPIPDGIDTKQPMNQYPQQKQPTENPQKTYQGTPKQPRYQPSRYHGHHHVRQGNATHVRMNPLSRDT